MFATSHKISLAALLFGTLSATLPGASLASHRWGNYHWARTSNPFTLKLGNNLSGAWKSDPRQPNQSYLGTASSDWSMSSVLDTTIVTSITDPSSCKPTSGRVEVCNADYGNNGWLGIAQIWARGSHITQGVTKMNDTYFNTQSYNTPAWRQMVLCQEIGHTLGLDHQDENFYNPNLGTCMDYTSNPSGLPSNEHPNAHDYVQLETIYGNHLDKTGTVNQSVNQAAPALPEAANAARQLGTAQWGKLIKSTNQGRTERYELDLGDGHKLFTFVIWAD
ncbi:MAG: hypothetical protein HYZ65_01270 [Burkholderiales bacterium]|nr:hypothetical protein [Burkholderiales bacterium]